jgi:hypothetical protein
LVFIDKRQHLKNEFKSTTADECKTVFTDTSAEHPNGSDVLVLGAPFVKYFNVQVDKENNRIGLVQP